MEPIRYTGLDVNEVRLLAFLIDKGLDQNFLRELFKIEEINWFLQFLNYKRIDRLIEWINDTYIEEHLQNIVDDLLEDRELQYNLDHSEFCYTGYVQWLVKTKTTEQIQKMIDDEIDLSDEYSYQHYMKAIDMIDLLRNSELQEFDQEEDPEEALINNLNKMALKNKDEMEDIDI
jgi:hypothetical protein